MFNYSSASQILLFFHNNTITAIPSGMFNYPLAKYFGISFGSNLISSIPSDIFNRQNATSIEIDLYRKLEIKSIAIPPGIFNYPLATNVYMMYLSSNQFSSIPSGIFN